ncbi:hypothetical protein [Siminovitchia sp. 179-K 8D1 HS]
MQEKRARFGRKRALLTHHPEKCIKKQTLVQRLLLTAIKLFERLTKTNKT